MTNAFMETEETFPTPPSALLEEKARLALSNVLLDMPHLAGLVTQVRLQMDERVATAAVFASGRMLFNPRWLAQLPLKTATFVMAHELMHLVLLTHERTDGSNPQLFNVAHDIIINQMLEKELGMKTPANGLTYKNVVQKASWHRFEETSTLSLEEVAALLNTEGNPEKIKSRPCWSDAGTDAEDTGNTDLGEALRQALGQGGSAKKDTQLSDVFTAQDEQQLFPKETTAQLKEAAKDLRQRVFEVLSAQRMHEAVAKTFGQEHGHGTEAGNSSLTYNALRLHYQPPWQWALQQWMEATAPARNTYARPSRRGEHRDFVRPGKERTGHTLHIVLDTSGSMTNELSTALGAIVSFCETTGVETVHVLQCDTGVTADEWLSLAELEKFEAKGFGGSDMSPGMERLAEDPEVERAIVITDGYIRYPSLPMPYEVLWVLTGQNDNFEPEYGRAIRVKE